MNGTCELGYKIVEFWISEKGETIQENNRIDKLCGGAAVVTKGRNMSFNSR